MTSPAAPPPPVSRRRSRWDPLGSKAFIPGVPTSLPVCLSREAMDAFLVRARLEEIAHKITSGQLDLPAERDRSPSPPPIYDRNGKRTNTREQRSRERLSSERQRLFERAIALYPGFRPPSDYKAMPVKKTRKIYIPAKKFPGFNFMGRIIGPRGGTQKELERETGAKIAIRGRGSEIHDKKVYDGDDDDLHVLITADREEHLERATRAIERLLIPVEEAVDEHKWRQLFNLSIINGTNRRYNTAWASEQGKFVTGVQVSCKICGEVSHPTSDCPLKHRPEVTTRIDAEVDRFMAEIATAPAPVDDMVSQFLSSIATVQHAPPAAASI